jgi:hypothetical protein
MSLVTVQWVCAIIQLPCGHRDQSFSTAPA